MWDQTRTFVWPVSQLSVNKVEWNNALCAEWHEHAWTRTAKMLGISITCLTGTRQGRSFIKPRFWHHCFLPPALRREIPLFFVTSHVPLIHTVSSRASKTGLDRVTAQKWQAYLKATPLYDIRLPPVRETPAMKACVLKWRRAADHGHRHVISFVSPLCELKGWWVTEWHWSFSDWWNAVKLMQSSLIAFSYVCFAVIKPRCRHAH